MRPFETLASVHTPDGRELSLHHRDGDYFIQLDGDELMSTRRSASEEALGELACEALQSVPRPRLLIGGLGLGFTLRAVLRALGSAEIVVAELFPEVVTWARGPLRALHGASLDDSRVRVEIGDVWDVLPAGGGWDGVVLDVDNGPEAWCLDANERLYSAAGLARLEDGMAPGGILAVWAARAAPAFVRALRSRGWEVQDRSIPAHGSKGTRHRVIVARRQRSRRGRR